jgi:hypothetical protein
MSFALQSMARYGDEMRHMVSSRAVALVLGLSLFAAMEPIARANDPAAEMLYQEGRRAAQARDWATACQKFQESNAREAAPGTLLNLADCEENRGKLIDAAAHFEAAANTFRADDERASYAKKRADAIDKRIAKLVVRLAPGTPAGATVERDGNKLDPGAIGVGARLNPGEHTFVVRAAGRADAKSVVRLAEGESRDVVLTAGDPITANAPPIAASIALADPHVDTSSPPNADHETSGSNSLRTLGYVGIGVGIAGVALGLVGGLETLSAKSAVNNECQPGCNSSGLNSESRGKTWSAISTTSFIVGGVGLASGIGLLVLAPKNGIAGGLMLHPTIGGAGATWTASF